MISITLTDDEFERLDNLLFDEIAYALTLEEREIYKDLRRKIRMAKAKSLFDIDL